MSSHSINKKVGSNPKHGIIIAKKNADRQIRQTDPKSLANEPKQTQRTSNVREKTNHKKKM